MQRLRRLAPLVGWVALLGAVLAGLHAAGGGRLAAPPLDPATWSGWVTDRGPLVAAVAVLRLVVLAAGWYLAVVTTLGVLGRIVRAARLVRAVDAVTWRPVRRLLHTALGVWVAASVATAAVPGPAVPLPAVRLASSGEVVLRHEGTDPPTIGEVVLPDQVADPPAGSGGPVRGPLPLRPGWPAGGGSGPEPGERVADTGAGDRVVEAGEPRSQVAAHVVRPGESFWSIAQDVLTDAWGRPPSDREIVGYWRLLIERNRAELVDPGNPDLIHPGQRFELPPVPGRVSEDPNDHAPASEVPP